VFETAPRRCRSSVRAASSRRRGCRCLCRLQYYSSHPRASRTTDCAARDPAQGAQADLEAAKRAYRQPHIGWARKPALGGQCRRPSPAPSQGQIRSRLTGRRVPAALSATPSRSNRGLGRAEKPRANGLGRPLQIITAARSLPQGCGGVKAAPIAADGSRCDGPQRRQRRRRRSRPSPVSRAFGAAEHGLPSGAASNFESAFGFRSRGAANAGSSLVAQAKRSVDRAGRRTRESATPSARLRRANPRCLRPTSPSTSIMPPAKATRSSKATGTEPYLVPRIISPSKLHSPLGFRAEAAAGASVCNRSPSWMPSQLTNSPTRRRPDHEAPWPISATLEAAAQFRTRAEG